MPDILASAQTSTPPLLPVRADVDLPFSSHAAPVPPEPLPEPVVPPPVPKKRGNKSLILAVLLFLLGTLPLAVYFTSQQRQLADFRGRAQEGPYACGPAGKSCNDVGDCGTNCSGQNWVCVGVSGQKTCQQHGPEDLCPGGSCTKINAYSCNALDSGGQCHENLRVDVGSWSAGVRHAAGCGQVDEVCRSGSRDNLGCGSFEIINTTCGTTTTTPPPGTGSTPPPSTPTPPPPPPPGSTPTPTPTSPSPPTATPTPTLPPGGTCELIRVYDAGGADITQAIAAGTRKLAIGEQITIATSKGNAAKARFRIQGIADWAENDPSKTTATEYRLSINIPSMLTQAQGTFEVEVFINGQWK